MNHTMQLNHLQIQIFFAVGYKLLLLLFFFLVFKKSLRFNYYFFVIQLYNYKRKDAISSSENEIISKINMHLQYNALRNS